MRLDVRGSGPPVVKIAGIAGGVGLFREEMDAAIRAGFRVAALDTSGDRADDPARAPLDWNGLGGEVIRAIDRLDERHAVLWGTSFGCLVALAAAARAPDRVGGLLLCHPPDVEWRPRLYRAIYRWAARRPNPGEFIGRLFSASFIALAGWEFLTPAALVRLPALAREARAAATPRSTLAEKLALLWEVPPGLPPPGSAIPASIVAGAWDTVAPPALARALAARLPGCRLRILGRSGHSGAYSRPRAYTRIAIEELRRLVGVDSP